jgi:hypothetical protein
LSYSIFRVKGITNTGAFSGLCKHDKERISTTNPDINQEKSIDNIDLIECNMTYKEKFNLITADMREDHNKRMETMRSDRVKTFEQYINTSKNNVGTEMIFTSDEDFFKSMSREEIKEWAQESLKFVTDNIGIKEENIIHAVVHMDEKTPHMHVVCVPLAYDYDKRAKEERWSINQTKFIGNRSKLSKLQDKYNEVMNQKGYALERGDKGTLKQHKETIDYKKEQIQKEVKSLSKSEDHIKSIIGKLNDVEVKQKAFSDKLTISKEDYSILMQLAKQGESKLLENTSMKAKINTLTEDKNKFKDLYNTVSDELKETKVKAAAYENAINDINETMKRMNIVKEFNEEYYKMKEEKEKAKQLNKVKTSRSFDRDI